MKSTASRSPEPEAPLPRGLVLFRPGTPTAVRRRRLIFLAVVLGAGAMVVWPIYPLLSQAFPLVFGLPRPLAWVITALGVVFAALLWLFWHDELAPRRDGREG